MEHKRTPLQQVVALASAESFGMRHDFVGTEHLLLALMRTGGPESKALQMAGANYETLRHVLEHNNGVGTATQKATKTTQKANRILEQARRIAGQNGDEEVFGDYILLALLNDRSSMASAVLSIANVDKREVYRNLAALMQKTQQAPDGSNKAGSNVEKYGKNLNSMAEAGKIDPVVGREKEINRVIQILSRRTKNNPVLIGEPGVGKTAIAEGLAQRIVENEVPDIMKGKTVYSLDMSTMVAGTKYRGDFEQRLNDTIQELIDRDDIIVFIDELHTIIGAGSAEGTLDASNILKPVLAKGELQIIGATTIDEYRQKIEQDAALERRFQPVTVEEPSMADAISIIKGLRNRYESFHSVNVSDEAVVAAVELTDRYLTDRYLPDKAIDVIDEAQARIRVDSYHIPQEVLDTEEMLLELEEEKRQAANTQDFERAAQLRDEITKLEEHLVAVKKEKQDTPQEDRPTIGFDEIAEVVSQWSNVPITKLTEKESDRYLHLAEELKERVIGQDYAVETVSNAIKRARVGLKSPKRPIGSFIFVGPTGVGKTYLAKAIAEVLFDGDQNLIRIDMSEYMEKYAVSRLIGAAPGYVGYDEGGQLTEAVRSKPYSVVLFDEIEKAHPDVFNILLQILDEGRLTDSKGRTVDFKNTVIILTSNVGASRLERTNRIGFGTEENVEKDEYDQMKEVVHEELKNTFRPEFLNRLDDTVVFHRLAQSSVREIAKLLLDQLVGHVGSLGYQLSYTNAVADHLAGLGFNPEFGARPLERTIRTKIEDLLAGKILSGEVNMEGKYELAIRKGEIELVEKPARKSSKAKSKTTKTKAKAKSDDAPAKGKSKSTKSKTKDDAEEPKNQTVEK